MNGFIDSRLIFTSPTEISRFVFGKALLVTADLNSESNSIAPRVRNPNPFLEELLQIILVKLGFPMSRTQLTRRYYLMLLML